MNPGRLNKRITFTRCMETENEVSELSQELQDFKTVWAEVKPLRGKEYLENKKIQPELIYKFTIRYRKDITPDMQIRFNNRLFNIQDIINPYERNEMLEITAVEKVVNNG